MQGDHAAPVTCKVERLDLSMHSDPQGVRDALSQALGRPPLCDLLDDLRSTAELVLAEVLNNIVEHAQPNRDGHIYLSVVQRPSGISCTLRDNGLPMPGDTPPPGWFPDDDAAGYPAEGGYGWYLIRALTNNLTYHRLGEENCLTFELNAKQSR